MSTVSSALHEETLITKKQEDKLDNNFCFSTGQGNWALNEQYIHMHASKEEYKTCGASQSGPSLKLRQY